MKRDQITWWNVHQIDNLLESQRFFAVANGWRATSIKRVVGVLQHKPHFFRTCVNITCMPHPSLLILISPSYPPAPADAAVNSPTFLLFLYSLSRWNSLKTGSQNPAEGGGREASSAASGLGGAGLFGQEDSWALPGCIRQHLFTNTSFSGFLSKWRYFMST